MEEIWECNAIRRICKNSKICLQGMFLSHVGGVMEYKMQVSRAGALEVHKQVRFLELTKIHAREKPHRNSWTAVSDDRSETAFDTAWKAETLVHVSQEWNVTGRKQSE